MGKKAYQKPFGPKIGSHQKLLYKLEHDTHTAIEAAAKELGRVLGYSDHQYWTHMLPEALLQVLIGYDQEAAKLAAIAYLEKEHQATVTLAEN